MNGLNLRFRHGSRRGGHILICLVCVCHQAKSDDSEFSASRTVIVVTDKAEAFAGNESVGKVPSGSVLRYSKEDGPWLLIPRYGGWLNREHVVALERAIPYFDDIVRKEKSPQAYQHRGIAHMSLGSYDSAIADFGRAIEVGLNDASVYINRGVARQRRGDLPGAVEDYSRAIELDATSARAYDNRANALAELGELDASIADSNEALRISPKYPEAFNNRGVTWRLKGDFEQAIADYTQAIEYYPHYAAAYANRGYARKQLGQLADAVADYTQAIALDSQNWQAHNDLAWLLATTSDEDLYDPSRAVELAQTACTQTRMRNPDYLDTLAAAQAGTGDFTAAVNSAEAALRIAPDRAKADIQQRLDLYRNSRPYREE
jgi:tetratricopeptide (TPR) repeat protein